MSIVDDFKALFGASFELREFLVEAEYKPELTSWDLRRHIESKENEAGLRVARVFSFVVTVAGTNFQKLGRRLTSYPNLLPALESYYNKYSFVEGKRIGKGKLSACFPEVELQAGIVVANRRSADCLQRLVAWHFSSKDCADENGNPITKGLEVFIQANITFVDRISGGKARLDHATRSNILRAVYADFAAKPRPAS